MFKTEAQLQKQNDGRFERRLVVDPVGNEGHWMWNSTTFKRKRKNGEKKEYPWMWMATNYGEVKVYARRYAWEMVHGPLADGMTIQNKCGWDRCIKPNLQHNRPIRKGDWNIKDPMIPIGRDGLIQKLRGREGLKEAAAKHSETLTEEEFMAQMTPVTDEDLIAEYVKIHGHEPPADWLENLKKQKL